VTPAALAALCRAALPDEHLTAGELEWVCFGDGAEIVGDELGCAVYNVKQIGGYRGAWLLLVAVEPAEQGKGRGKALVAEVVERSRAAGARDLHVANAVPRYLWPGVDLMNTRAAAFVEGLGFDEGLLGINMAIPASFRRAPAPGVVVERETSRDALAFCEHAYPHWVPELARAIELGTAFAARADGSTIGFSCHSVNRRGWIGPMATDPQLQHSGVGSATLAAVCEDLERSGLPVGEIAWVSNLRFYAKCGATVSRVFRGGRLALAPG
jgi:GNAT superfamily N-acetyltransferase